MFSLIDKCNKEIGVSRYRYRSRLDSEASLRIVQVSDLQSEYFGRGQSELHRVVSGLSPDVVVITGDLVDREHTDFLAAKLAVDGLLRVAPVFYVNGNHEADLATDEAMGLYRMLKRMGVHVLLDRHEVVSVNRVDVRIGGLSSYSLFLARGQQAGTGRRTRKHGLNEAALVRCGRRVLGEPNGRELRILLAHEPQYLGLYLHAAPDIIFSGHAHGGQFCLPGPGRRGLYAPDQGLLPKLTQGAHCLGRTTMFISRGLGNSSFPIRLNNPPEIVCVDVD